MHLRTLILYPEEARAVAAETVRRVKEAPAKDGYVRPAILPDGRCSGHRSAGWRGCCG